MHDLVDAAFGRRAGRCRGLRRRDRGGRLVELAVGEAAAAHGPRRAGRLPGHRSCGRPRSSTPTTGAPVDFAAPCPARRDRRGIATAARSDRRERRSCWSPRALCACAAIAPSCSRRYTPDDRRRRGGRPRDRLRPRRRARRRHAAAGRARAAAAAGATRCCCATTAPRATCSPGAASRGSTVRARRPAGRATRWRCSATEEDIVIEVWAPRADRVRLRRDSGGPDAELDRGADGWWRRLSTSRRRRGVRLRPRRGRDRATRSAVAAASPAGCTGRQRTFDHDGTSPGPTPHGRAASSPAGCLRAAHRHLHARGNPGCRDRPTRPPGRPRHRRTSSCCP